MMYPHICSASSFFFLQAVCWFSMSAIFFLEGQVAFNPILNGSKQLAD